ncbi:MAG: hypothetical protein O7A98_10150 [Acidobacteria bacterium]|nr:hypothetical protein [Acidobacteriota bacterium]
MKPPRNLIAGTLLLGSLVPILAAAQAWAPPKGQGFLALTTQSLDATNHLFSAPVLGTTSLDIGKMEGRALVLDADFGITDKLAITTSLAYVSSRFREGGRIDETNPASAHRDLPSDDGRWHSSLQDARVSLRYMQRKGPWVFTPSAAVVFPLRNYNTLGHASIGRGVNEAQLGLEVGRLLYRSGRPRAYAQGGYRYAFVEKVGETSLNRSDFFLELGYLAHPRLTVRGFAEYRASHGGVDWIEVLQGQADFHGHDQVAAAQWLRAGVGLSMPMAEGVDFFVSVAQTLEGENTHDGTTFSIGTTWGFQAPGYGRTKIRFPGP